MPRLSFRKLRFATWRSALEPVEATLRAFEYEAGGGGFPDPLRQHQQILAVVSHPRR